MNFSGTDTIAAVQVCKKYYNYPMAGFSVPASEHRFNNSVIVLKRLPDSALSRLGTGMERSLPTETCLRSSLMVIITDAYKS